MTHDRYTLTARLEELDLPAAEEAVRAALAEEGFGVLTEIDVARTLKEKLDVDLPGYRILGACNPGLAHRGLQADPDLGALLPCNVVVRAAADGGTEVLAADPIAMLGVSEADGLAEVAEEARAAIERALARL